jgi:hypothetical protein
MEKKPSGQQFRKQRREREEAERVEEAVRRDGGESHLDQYEDLGPPPTDDPTKALIYAQNCMLIALREVITDKQLTARDRWKFIAQFGGQIGVTHAKALMQHKMDKVTKRLSNAEEVSGGPQSLRGVTKPPTARGGRSDSAGEPLHGYLPSPPESEDE